MSQYAPRRGLPTSPDAYSNPDIDADVEPGHRWDSRRSQASSPASPTSPTTPTSPISPYSPSLDDSSIGRSIYAPPPVSSVGSLSQSGQRSPRRPVPSPLSTTSIVASSATSTSPHDPRTSAINQRTRREQRPGGRQSADNPAGRLPVRQTTFYSDSSSPSSPDEEISGLDFKRNPNENRSASDSVTSKVVTGSNQAATAAMAPSMASATGESMKGLPRNSSIDTAISVMSSKHGAASRANSLDEQNATDVESLIETAGSAEAVIQHLLKEKHSQSQQNSQLWRLVDKQRAMILGLNKDLEAALKEKEKYRKKLKELMANPAVMRAASGQDISGTSAPASRIDVKGIKSQAATSPDSPGLDSDSQKNSPTDISIAPYPITPPADKPHVLPTAVSELLDPKHAMPKPQEHALDKFDHEAEEQDADKVRKDKNVQQLREIPYNISLPPSRSYPSEPPKVPPPRLPTTAAPPLAADFTPQPDKQLRQFPSPPRKGPPAPLQLKQQRNIAAATEDDESDSDYDDILEVGDADVGRGRRKTRDEDDRGREITSSKVDEKEDSTSEDDSESEVQSSFPERQRSVQSTSNELNQKEHAPSMDAVLRGDEQYQKLVPHGYTAGLPSSPHPFGNIQHSASAPLSDRMPPPTGVSGQLSPRPPRQAIPLPPNTPLASPPALATPDGSSSILSVRSLKQQHQPKGSSEYGTERTKIYKGLVTEEYPDLLLPPNALPSIMISVASSRMKPSRASLMSLTQLEEDPVFTLAIISRADGGELWRVEKDIASLSKLDQRLKQCNAFTARTPDRSLFSGHAPAKLDARRVALEQYLEELLDTQLDNTTAVELCKYLSTHTLPPNADETGSSFRPTPENSGLKVASDGRPFRSGYLTKKGKNFGGWKARFFVLEGPQLKYYETPGGAHLGTIKLQNAQIGKQSQAPSNENQSPARAGNGEELDNQYRHAFLILEPKKKDSSAHVKHVLCAENDKERDLWVDALLQWIDYRDPDETEPQSAKSFAQDRQMIGSDQPSGGRSKKSGQTKATHQQTDSDGLIGVRYDSTHAGDMPQGAPVVPKGSSGLAEHNLGVETMSSQASKTISAPKDPQIISDSSAWGNKIGLMAPPTHDEKKQRKRSFFGFGPKTRSSSDGQDSLFGGSESGSLAGPSQGSYQGPVRQVFGAPLAEAVRYNPPTDVEVPLPSVVYRCIQYLDSKNAIEEEGIFRLSGSNVVIKQLRERFNVEGDVNLVTDEQYYDIHAVASLLKLYLRELPTTILTRDLHLDFLSTTEIPDRQEKVAKLNELAQKLPQANATLLKYLIAFLIRIINKSDINKMNVRNVGIVFSPTLNIPAQVFAMFLQNYEGIFGIDPEEYELPSPTEESDSQGQADVPSLRFEPPPRPSTSSGSASPHRQPRLESRREHSRSTPTPPLMSTVQGARSTPTPPLGVPTPQNVSGPSGRARPAYESGYPMPAGHEAHGYHAAQRPTPGYDRPIYQSSSEDPAGGSQAVEQPQSNNSRRRESAIYMGGLVGLQHQGSKSRLRDEAHF